MLIVTRKDGEKISIGEDITVSILASKTKQVLIGIEAPDDISVHREEVYLRIKEDREGNSVIPFFKQS